MKEHNCYKCQHVKEVPGSAHKECTLFKNSKKITTLLLATVMIRSKYPMQDIGLKFTKEETGTQVHPIELHEIGLNGGWAMWPLNFDPKWVTKCMFYQKKENETI